MTPKPLSDAVNKGFAYLLDQQHADGGWSQGGGWRTTGPQGGRVEGPNVDDPPDVANTCTATLVLLRGGHTPREGEYSANVVRGLDFVIGHVERADAESPYVTEVRGTQVQSKIGPFVDTFLAAMVLAEAKGQMPDDAAEARLSAALDKTVAKMESNQNADGSWSAAGWAAVVGHSLGSAGLNRAKQRGAKVSDETVERLEKYSRSHYDSGSASYTMDGSAGVPLYGSASHLSSAQHSLNSLKGLKVRLQSYLKEKTAAPDERDKAEKRLKDIEEGEQAQEASLGSYAARFKDSAYLQGFGSNGGEEFLSYLNISETLLVKGGEEWTDWDRLMTQNLERIQNKDGSWAGHHCITGRTFCTAAALLVLLADRAPRPEPVMA